MLGKSREELLQKTATEFIAQKSSKIFTEQIRELYRNEKETLQITTVLKDGIFFPVDLNMELIEYKGKQAIFSIVRNIME
ncbi:hypothetical protein MSMAS_1792 [Methanosarcina mazei S-6]|uniref:PAS domain-containing protein n=2 Tax=Methanosarcina mazei TaxID=2209 RepID=A0A0E3RKS6_METMZ|nr:hypothetical protein MSMAS_1792 [Methanosarcina mazei S-6]